MPLHAIPVMIPYRIDDDPQAPVLSLHIETVASGDQAAIAIARVLLETHVRLRRHSRPKPMLERTVVGPLGAVVAGPYAYCFTAGDRIPSLVFPRRLEGSAAADFDATLSGLERPWAQGLVFDCAPLQHCSSEAMAALVRHTRRLLLQCFRVPEGIGKILRLAGLHKHLNIHPDLAGALGGLLHQGTSRHRDTKRVSA